VESDVCRVRSASHRGDNARIEPEATSISNEAGAAAAARFSVAVSAHAAVKAVFAATGLGLCVVWAWHDGGFFPEEWLPGGLLLLALLCTAAASVDVRARLRTAPLPLVLFGLYVGWSYLSILWAQVPADALNGANRTLVYLLMFALFTGLGIAERLGSAIVLAWGLALATLGVVELIRVATATTSAGVFDQGRLSAPISYADGDAALFLSACLPLVVLASRRQAHAPWRLVACIGAVVLADLSVLCQSRGSLVWFPCALALYLAVARNRLRALAHIVIVAAAVAPAVPSLLHVYSSAVAGDGGVAAVRSALLWVIATAALAAVGLAALMVFERQVTLSRRGRVVIGTSVAVLIGAAIVSSAVVVAGSHPLGRAERAWHNFTTNKAVAPTRTAHFASGFGTSRYDVWRISVRQFLAHPLTGVGSDNYIVGYLRQRRTHETSRYPESVELRAFSETGIIGAALFLGFLALAFVRAGRAARRSRSPGLALACFVGAGYWLLHASTDWFWELPALTGAGLALLAIASAPTPTGPASVRRPMIRGIKVAVAAGAALVAAAALAIPWASVSLIDAAVARGPGPRSSSLLDTAATLNPWSEQPALARATLAARAGRPGQEQRALHEALGRDPYDWYAYLILGIIAGREHQTALARTELARARTLSPEDLVVSWAQTRLRWGLPLTQREVNRVLRGG
jgi:O-Antigen ligase